MSLIRVLLAAIVGGAVVFGWGAVSHMFLGIGEMGIGSLPEEEMLVPVFEAAVTERSFLMFPAMPDDTTDEAAMKSWEERYLAGPRGALVFEPAGNQLSYGLLMGTEYVSTALAALVAALVLAFVRAGYVGRVLLVTLMGVFAWLSVDVSFWNWYRLPTGMAISGLIDQGAGWLLGGLVIAAIAPKRAGDDADIMGGMP